MIIERCHERCASVQELDEGDAEVLQEQLCSALCCLAEAQMGMAGEVQEVAEECEALLLRAAQAAQSSPEPMQVGHPSLRHLQCSSLHQTDASLCLGASSPCLEPLQPHTEACVLPE